MTRVVLTDSDRFPFGPADLEMLSGAGVGLDEVPGHDPDAIAAAAAGADAVFVYSGRFDAALIGRLEGCRVLARCGVGYDNIDIAAARARGIVVTYVPAYGAEDVAEHAIALMLACARRLAASDRTVQSGGWPSFAGLGPMRRLAGRTLGLVGYGRIAREVAARARGLRMQVIAHDPYVDPTAGAPLDVRLMPLAEMLATSDFVSVHVPLGPATRHLIGDAALSAMRPDAYLINTSRGAVVDQDALVRALDAGRIGGAALDVLEQEPAPAGAAILGRPNVLITPHSAAYTQEALEDVRRTALTDVLLIIGGSQPRFPVPDLVADHAKTAGPGADGGAAATRGRPVNPSADGLFALDGDVAVVTGGASGFGRAIAAALAGRGCKTAILDRDEAGALAAADELGCLGIGADVRDRDAVAAAWQQITGQLGPPGLLVNSAGIGGWSAALGYPAQLWQDVIDINLTGTLNCCLVAAESMASSGGGAIVNMASVMGEVGFPGLVGYAASKGGVIQVTRALAVEFAANGIRVNAVAPSTFDTPLALGNRALRPEVYERLRARTPLDRFGQVGEIVGPVLFLLSKAASMVTGHVLAVDGGYLAS